MGTFTQFDLCVFVGSLLAVMIVGLWAGRKEKTSEDYYLAGKSTRWWGVAGSIFGSNVSANHIVGMMGVGFSLGFVESHFEITAIAGLLLLCYGFLPVYRRLNLYTLSEYLGRRYNEPCRVIYAMLMLTTIVIIQMVPAFYIGSRSLNILFLEESKVSPTVSSTVQNAMQEAHPPAGSVTKDAAQAAGTKPRAVRIQTRSYVIGILVMALVTGIYTIVGGLKAVIVTDVLQSIMMITAALIVAILTFGTSEIGGWSGMMATDRAAGAMSKMHLYLPSSHPQRPWTGVLTGLLILHVNYWGTNQFIVQRALSARSDRDARIGIIFAGFFKLAIPFLSIGTGVAAYYLFLEQFPGAQFDGDTAFPMLIRQVVSPVGFGIVGLVAAGLVGAILSSIDSMLNSGATIITFDLYRRYLRPQASEAELILAGRLCIAVFVGGAALLTILVMDPNREEHFFTYVAGHTSKLVTGVVVAFVLGMFWRRATPAGGLAAILAGVVASYSVEAIYNKYLGTNETIAAVLGTKLNFLHSAFIAAVLAAVVHVVVSLATRVDAKKSLLTWTALGGHDPLILRKTIRWLIVSLAIYAVLGMTIVYANLNPTIAGIAAAAWTWSLFLASANSVVRQRDKSQQGLWSLLTEDRTWAGLLAATAIFMLYHYY
jgi:SSS family solute:Na+ symporter